MDQGKGYIDAIQEEGRCKRSVWQYKCKLLYSYLFEVGGEGEHMRLGQSGIYLYGIDALQAVRIDRVSRDAPKHSLRR